MSGSEICVFVLCAFGCVSRGNTAARESQSENWIGAFCAPSLPPTLHQFSAISLEFSFKLNMLEQLIIL